MKTKPSLKYTINEIRRDAEEARRKADEQLDRQISRVTRAHYLVEFVNAMNQANIRTGAVGGFGQSEDFDFNAVFGPVIDKETGEIIEEGKTYEQVAAEAVEYARKAGFAAKKACESCGYSPKCPRAGRLYEKLSEPEQVELRKSLRNRAEAIIKAKGTKTMNCFTAVKVKNPKKTDWTW